MSGMREGEQKVIMANRKMDIDLDYKGLEQCLEGIGRDFQGEGYGLDVYKRQSIPIPCIPWYTPLRVRTFL